MFLECCNAGRTVGSERCACHRLRWESPVPLVGYPLFFADLRDFGVRVQLMPNPSTLSQSFALHLSASAIMHEQFARPSACFICVLCDTVVSVDDPSRLRLKCTTLTGD